MKEKRIGILDRRRDRAFNIKFDGTNLFVGGVEICRKLPYWDKFKFWKRWWIK